MSEDGPQRTCAITRRSAPRDALLRLVVDPDGQVVVDARGNLPGRGAWILPDAETLTALPSRAGALKRVLGVVPDGARLVDDVRDACLRGALDGLSIAAAAGVVVPGQDRVQRALVDGRVDTVALSSDLSPRTVRAVSELAAAVEGTVVHLDLSSEALGARVGRGATGVLAVGPSRPGRAARRWLRRLFALG